MYLIHLHRVDDCSEIQRLIPRRNQHVIARPTARQFVSLFLLGNDAESPPLPVMQGSGEATGIGLARVPIDVETRFYVTQGAP